MFVNKSRPGEIKVIGSTFFSFFLKMHFVNWQSTSSLEIKLIDYGRHPLRLRDINPQFVYTSARGQCKAPQKFTT